MEAVAAAGVRCKVFAICRVRGTLPNETGLEGRQRQQSFVLIPLSAKNARRPPRRCRWSIYVAIVLAATLAASAKADPKNPQCWECLKRLALELPAINPQEDPLYEEGLTPGSVLPALANCSLDDKELPRLQQIIEIFSDAQAEHGGATYVSDHLARLHQVNSDDRAKLVDGARQDLDTTLRHLVDHNCRILLQSHFDQGASQRWILRMVEIGETSNEPS